MASSVLYLSHGGGPLPLLGDASHQDMLDTLHSITMQLQKPSAIIVISAHWETDVIRVTSAAAPPLLYDYYGFEQAAYQLQYPVAGSPKLAKALIMQLKKANIACEPEPQRGLDHGVFVPLLCMYPNADIPCIQLSLQQQLEPEFHIKLGQALAPLAQQDVLFVGSGFSFHNMQAFFRGTDYDDKNLEFEHWLQHTMTSTEITEEQRYQRLLQWQQAPYARYCHPREEHLLPLHVCYGIAGTQSTKTFQADILHKRASFFLWQL